MVLAVCIPPVRSSISLHLWSIQPTALGCTYVRVLVARRQLAAKYTTRLRLKFWGNTLLVNSFFGPCVYSRQYSKVWGLHSMYYTVETGPTTRTYVQCRSKNLFLKVTKTIRNWVNFFTDKNQTAVKWSWEKRNIQQQFLSFKNLVTLSLTGTTYTYVGIPNE